MVYQGLLRNLARGRHTSHTPGEPGVERLPLRSPPDRYKRRPNKPWFYLIFPTFFILQVMLFITYFHGSQKIVQKSGIESDVVFSPDIPDQRALSNLPSKSVVVKQSIGFDTVKWNNYNLTTKSQSNEKEENRLTDSEFSSCLSTKEYESPRDDEAYITFLTGNQGGYVAGVLTLALNLEVVGARRPLVVMTLADVPEVELEYLHKAGLKTIPVPSLPNPNCKKGLGRPCNRGRDNYSKIAVFSLTQYRRLVYLDSDMVISSNIDELFCFSAFTSCKINTCTAEDCHKLNSGLLVLHPDAEVFQDMLSKYTTMQSYNKGDQGFLSTYFDQPSAPPRHFIDGNVYNIRIHSTLFDKEYCESDILASMQNNGTLARVRHFMDATKPWVWYNGREMQDWGKARMDSSNACFQITMRIWETNYLTILDKFEGLAEHLNKTVKLPVSDSTFDMEAEGGTLAGWKDKIQDNFDSGGVLGPAEQVAESASGLKVTVAILNWKRPKSVQHILMSMVDYQSVAEILVWHCNNETIFNYNHPKVRHIVDPAANDRWGMNTRYKNCLQAKTSQVLIVDDDILPVEGTVNNLLVAAMKYPNRIHSLHGHNPSPGCRYGYKQAPPGPAMVVLTKVMLLDRQLCSDYFEYTDMMEEVAHQGKPYWNGEDIYMSLVSTKVTGNLPVRHNLPYDEPRTREYVTFFSQETQRDYVDFRTTFIRAAASKLGVLC